MGQTSAPAQFNSYGLLWKQHDFIGQLIEHHYDNFGRETNKTYFAVGAITASYAVSYVYNQLNQLTNVTQFYGSAASQFYATLNPNGKGYVFGSLSARLMAALNRNPSFYGGATALLMLGMALAMIPPGRRRQWALVFVEAWHAHLASLAPARGEEIEGGVVSVSGQCLCCGASPDLSPQCWHYSSSQPGIDQLWSAHGQCVYPPNPSYQNTFITTFTYDVEGNVTQVNSPQGVVNYTYNLATARVTDTCTTNSETEYNYDQLGRLQSVTAVKRNGVMLMSPETTTYTYDAVGNRSLLSLPNGIVTIYHYDDLNRLTNVVHPARHNQSG